MVNFIMEICMEQENNQKNIFNLKDNINKEKELKDNQFIQNISIMDNFKIIYFKDKEQLNTSKTQNKINKKRIKITLNIKEILEKESFMEKESCH